MLVKELKILLLCGAICWAWDEPLDTFDTFLEDALLGDLTAEDHANEGNSLNLLQATAKLHHRGPENDIPQLSGGGSLAAAIDGSLESSEAARCLVNLAVQ
eukprot:g15117.t1